MTNTPELKAALTEQLEALGIDVDRRKGVAGLQTQLMQVKAHRAKAAEKRAEREAAQAAENQATLERIEARGPWGDMDWHTEMTREDKDLFYAVSKYRDVISSHEEFVAKFAEKLLSNPEHALSWSTSQFEHAAEYSVAHEIKRMFDGGAKKQFMAEYAMTQAMRGAKRAGSKSTSMVSNLMEDHVTAAWADAHGMLSGTRY